MRKANWIGTIALLAVGAATAPALAGNVTVGRFYKEIAQAKSLVAVDESSAEASLRGAGFNLPTLALEKSLTEGEMTSISTVLGLAVRTERPSQLISDSQLSTFMASFGSQIAAPAAGTGSPFQTDSLPPQSARGKGKKKGHHKSVSEPI